MINTSRFIITILTLWGCVSFPVSAKQQLSTEYDIHWKGFRIATSEINAEWQTGAQYKLDMTSRARGLARLFFGGKGMVVAKGALDTSGDPVATSFRSYGKWDGETYDRMVRFGPDGHMIHIEKDWPEKWQEDGSNAPVPEDLRLGPDPFSVLIALITKPNMVVAKDDSLKFRAYDGETVHDIQLICDAPSELLKSKRSPYSGTARRCELNVEQIAGFFIETEEARKKREKREAKAREKRERKKARNAKKGKKPEEPVKEGLYIWMKDFSEIGAILPVRAELLADGTKVSIYLKSHHYAPSVSFTDTAQMAAQ